jgi:hypothetical protein
MTLSEHCISSLNPMLSHQSRDESFKSRGIAVYLRDTYPSLRPFLVLKIIKQIMDEFSQDIMTFLKKKVKFKVFSQ